MAGAIGTAKGYLGINQSYFDDNGTNKPKSAFMRFGAGIEGTPNVDISRVFIWEGTNNYVAQFDVLTNAPNFTQGNFNSLANGGTVGLCGGIMEIALDGPGTNNGPVYLIMPNHAFVYFNSSTNKLTCFITCPKIAPR